LRTPGPGTRNRERERERLKQKRGENHRKTKTKILESLTPGAYTEKRRADFSKFLFVLIQIDIKMIKKGI
jgi:hypothetical protein